MAWIDFFNIFTKSAKVEKKPTKENHGSSYNSGGVKNPFSAMSSLQAYGNHGYLYAAITRSCEDLAALPLKLVKGKGKKAKIINDHPVLDLLHNPSVHIDNFLLREQILLDLILSGSCYLLMLGQSEKPESIIRLHPDEVKIVTNELGIAGYEHNSSGSIVVYPPDRILTARNASYHKGPRSLYGVGAVESLRKELAADFNVQSLASQASSQGHPDILISPKDGDIWPNETRKQISDNYQKLAKSGGVMVLSGEAQITPLNLSVKDMEFQAIREHTMQVISSVIGIGPSVLGMPDANFATSRQQALTYWQVQKKRAKRIDIMFSKLAQLWDKDLYVYHDFSDVEPLQSVRTEQLKRINLHIQNGMMPADAYAYEGLDDAPGVVDDFMDDEGDLLIDEKAEKTIIRLLEQKDIVTNFPKVGDDKEINLKNSNHEQFPIKKAEYYKENYPTIWAKGGNVIGNRQYKILQKIVKNNGNPINKKEEEAIKLRESWSARHKKDYLLAGVVAQMKWLTVGSRGLDHMLNVLDDEVNKIENKQKKKCLTHESNVKKNRAMKWNEYYDKRFIPNQKKLLTGVKKYLKEAKKRYVKRARQNIEVVETKALYKKQLDVFLVDLNSLKAKKLEIKEFEKIINELMYEIHEEMGQDQIDKIMQAAKRDKIKFVQKKTINSHLDKLANQITSYTIKVMDKIIKDAQEDPIPKDEILNKIEGSHVFSDKRADRIATTETTYVNNTAILEAMVQAEEEGLQLEKAWISEGDDRVRPTHEELDGDVINIDENFVSLSGAQALAPGEFDDPEENIYCRCTMEAVIIGNN